MRCQRATTPQASTSPRSRQGRAPSRQSERARRCSSATRRSTAPSSTRPGRSTTGRSSSGDTRRTRNRKSTLLSNAVYGFFDNGGTRCFIVNTGGDAGLVDALAAAAVEDEIAIVAAPDPTDPASHDALLESLRTARGPGCDPRHARGGRRHRAPDAGRDGAGPAAEEEVRRRRRAARGGCRGRRPAARRTPSAPDGSRLRGLLLPVDHGDGPDRPTRSSTFRRRVTWPASGRAPTPTRGVHKAPANESVSGALEPDVPVTRDEQGVLNDVGVNCIRPSRDRGHPRLGRAHAGRRCQRVALPQRPAALQHDRGVDRTRAPTGSSSSRTTARCGSTSGETSARSSPASGATAG